MFKEHFKILLDQIKRQDNLRPGFIIKTLTSNVYIFTRVIFYSMGNEICSAQIEHKQQQNQKRAQVQKNQAKFEIIQENHSFKDELSQFDNPSRQLNDHAFLKTTYTASNNKMFIPAKVKYSREIKHQNVQLICLKTPSLYNLQSFDFSLEHKKTTSYETLTHNAQQKNRKKQREKTVMPANRQRRFSLDQALSNKQNNQQEKNLFESSSQSILKQVSDYILTERNLFAPKKILKSIFVKNRFQSILNEYNFIIKVGQGSYGNVYKAHHKQNNELRAIKVLKKSRLSKQQHEKTINQIQILKKLDHPNILKIFQIYFDTKSVSIVTQFCQGGSLYKLIKKSRLCPRTIKSIFRKLMTALAYLHTENIVHRDIKLDNIVLVSKYDQNNQQQADIRLIDFGLSKFSTVKRFKDRQKIGTCTHMAPQVLEGLYSTKSDVWSAGILLCYLALGFNPFKGSTKEITFDKIQSEELRFQRGQWKNVDIQLKDLLMKMLDKKIGQRITAAEVLNHPWLHIEERVEQTKVMLEKVTKKLYDYYRGNNLVTIVQSYIAYTTTPHSQINQCSWIFSALDRDHDGSISTKQLQFAFRNSAIGFQKKQIDYVLQKVKEQHYGKINFTEFVSILSDREKMFAKKSLIEAFNYIDIDNSGYIDKKQLKEILNITQSQISCIIKQIDSNKDLKISKDQFVKYLQDGNFY